MSSTSSFVFDRPDRRTKKVSRTLIAAVARQIEHFIKPAKIILFGSQASGIRESSDIDLFIQIHAHHPLARLSRSQRAAAVLELFRYRSFGLDVLVYTDHEVDYLRKVNEGEWDLVLEILDSGKGSGKGIWLVHPCEFRSSLKTACGLVGTLQEVMAQPVSRSGR